MKRAEVYRVYKGSRNDPRKSRAFVLVSRQVVVDSKFSTVICAPIYTSFDGLSSQVLVGVAEGLKHDSSVHCDELVSIPKSSLADFIGRLNPEKVLELNLALEVALGLK